MLLGQGLIQATRLTRHPRLNRMILWPNRSQSRKGWP